MSTILRSYGQASNAGNVLLGFAIDSIEQMIKVVSKPRRIRDGKRNVRIIEVNGVFNMDAQLEVKTNKKHPLAAEFGFALRNLYKLLDLGNPNDFDLLCHWILTQHFYYVDHELLREAFLKLTAISKADREQKDPVMLLNQAIREAAGLKTTVEKALANALHDLSKAQTSSYHPNFVKSAQALRTSEQHKLLRTYYPRTELK